MPAFGQSAEQRQSVQNLRGIPPQMLEIFNQMQQRGVDFGNMAEPLRQWFVQQLQQQADQGVGPVATQQNIGQQIAPFDETIASRRGRLSDIYNTNPDVSGTGNEINSRVDEYGRAISNREDTVRDITTGGYGRMADRAGAAGRDITGNIRDSFGAGSRNYNAAFGDAGGGYNRSFGDLISDLDPAFASADRNVAMLKPGGDFAAARSARAFAPQMAATNRRLRASGVDPNSPQAIAALNNVGAQRSRAMDDAMAEGTEKYVGASNDLILNRLGMRTGLGRERANTNLNLGREQANTNLNLTMGEGEAFRREMGRQLGVDLGIEEGQIGANTANANRSAELARDYMSARNQAALTGRDLTIDDWRRTSDLAREMNQEDLDGLTMRIQQYGLGMGHTQADQGVRERATNQIGQQAQQATENDLRYRQGSMPFGQAAYTGYQNTYDRETPQGNSLLRPILGAAAGALNLVAPGAGTAFGTVMGGGQRPGQQRPPATPSYQWGGWPGVNAQQPRQPQPTGIPTTNGMNATSRFRMLQRQSAA